MFFAYFRDLETQKTFGAKVKYIPIIQAVQLFDGSKNPPFIRNGVYLSSFPLVEFEGVFRWLGERRRLEFDFWKVMIGSIIFNDAWKVKMVTIINF